MINERSIKYLWTLTFIYVLVLLTADLYETKLINIYWLHAGAGILIFPLTYLLINIITEVYGYKRARFTIWCGFLFCAIFLLFAQLVMILPCPQDAYCADGVDSLIAATSRIFVATIMTVIIAESINAYIIAKLKIRFSGKYVGFRFILSTLIATGISMLLFCMIAFYGKISGKNFFVFMLTSWVFRFSTELLLLPVSVKISTMLKRLEKMDIYDMETSFNPFKLDNHYSEDKNRYKK